MRFLKDLNCTMFCSLTATLMIWSCKNSYKFLLLSFCENLVPVFKKTGTKRQVSYLQKKFWNYSEGNDTHIVYYVKNGIGSSSCTCKCLYAWSSLSNTESSNQYREKDLKEMFTETCIHSYLSRKWYLFINLC